MNFLNRLLALVLILLLLALGLVLMLFPREVLQWTRLTIEAVERAFTPVTQATLIVAGLGLALLAVILLLLELTPRRPAAVRLLQVSSGEARLTTDAIAQRIKRELEALPDILRVTPQVHSRGKSVDLRLAIETDSEADVGPAVERACQLAREVAETRMGVRVNRVWASVAQGAATKVRLATPSEPGPPANVASDEVR
jgi:hypothetical protein